MYSHFPLKKTQIFRKKTKKNDIYLLFHGQKKYPVKASRNCKPAVAMSSFTCRVSQMAPCLTSLTAFTDLLYDGEAVTKRKQRK